MPATPASSSAAWRRAATSAGSRARPAKPRVVLDAAGKDIVLIETVGVGQDEVDIVRTADVSIVTHRAGHRRRGAGAEGRHHGDRRHLRRQQGGPRRGRSDGGVDRGDAVAARHSTTGEWRPPIVKTEATTGRGVPELLETIERFKAHTAATQGSRRRARAEWRLRELLGHARSMRARRARACSGAEFEGVRLDASRQRRSIRIGGRPRSRRTRVTEVIRHVRPEGLPGRGVLGHRDSWSEHARPEGRAYW